MNTQLNSAPATTNEVLLTVNGLTKHYGSFQALKQLSFQMARGEIISVLGPSGCGKSTLLQLVAGLAQPDDGEIRLNGEIIASRRHMLPPEKRGVNMVFQDYALWPHLSVFDNIAYGLKRKRMERGALKQRIEELLALLQLAGLEQRLPPQLSGGQQQRVAIARALATEPNLMLLDEPLSNLDMRLRIEMRTEMAYLFRRLGSSVFHVTHDPEEAFAMADRLMIMRGGRIDQIGTPEQCFSRPASRWAASLMGAINSLRGEYAGDAGGGPAVRVGTMLLRGVLPEQTPTLADGDPVIIMFRPEDMTTELLPLDSAAVSNSLPLRRMHCTFEGNRWRSLAATACGQRLYILQHGEYPSEDHFTATLPITRTYIYPFAEER